MTQNFEKTYLIIADETAEFDSALRYAARSAKADGVHLAILLPLVGQDFMHWGLIEERVKMEQRELAEAFLEKVSERIAKITDIAPSFVIEEGDSAGDVALRVMENNPGICKLILGANTHHGGANPLLDYFTGKGIGKLSVPLMVVPDHIPFEKIDDLV